MGKYFDLYHYWRSSCSWRLRWVLNIKNVQYNLIPINLLAGEHKNDEYKIKNPSSVVPTLKIKDNYFGESLAIIEYIDESFPEPPLMPKDSISRLKVKQLAYTISSGTQPLQNLSTQSYHSQRKEEQNRFACYWIEKGFYSYEKQIKSSNGFYSFGNTVSLADVCLIPQVYNAIRFGVDMDMFPKIFSVYNHCLEKDSCKKSHPDIYKP
ncbi:MAG: maleylacetoacetate isomerase [Zetaproteobacteria bacterium]|nr:maleylacetoacetate isomerase [Pseudobdellovibrionaceae bacterium]